MVLLNLLITTFYFWPIFTLLHINVMSQFKNDLYKSTKITNMYMYYQYTKFKISCKYFRKFTDILVLNVQWCAHRCRGFQDKIQVVSKYMYHIILTMVPVCSCIQNLENVLEFILRMKIKNCYFLILLPTNTLHANDISSPLNIWPWEIHVQINLGHPTG